MTRAIKRSAWCLLLLFVMVGCLQPPEQPIEEAILVETISVNNTVVKIQSSATATISFEVEDPEADFVYQVENARCQVAIRLAESFTLSKYLVLTNIEKNGGRYVATLQDLGLKANYTERICLVIFNDLTKRDEMVKSAVIDVVCGTGKEEPDETEEPDIPTVPPTADERLADFRFEAVNNPYLVSTTRLSFDSTSMTYSGRFPNLLNPTALVPSFSCSATVTVNNVEQISGESAVNFLTPVIYTVTTSSGEKYYYTIDVKSYTGLPVVVVNTENGAPINSRSTWINGVIAISGEGKYDPIETTSMQIRGRGNSTWGWAKKPYVFKLENRTSILGMPKHKRWILLANHMDRTLLRNTVAFKISEQTSLAYTVRTVFVELILNGKYVGNYQLCEQIRVDKHRVDITEMTVDDTEGDEVTGGYLLELDTYYEEGQWRTPNYYPVNVKYPDEEEIQPAQLSYIQNYFALTEEAIYGSNFRDPDKGFRAYLDDQSFIDYWLCFEVTNNREIGHPKSVYMYKDRLGKLVAGPIWDFDWNTFSFENEAYYAQYGLFMTDAFWYKRLFEDPEFRALAKERWNALKPAFETIPQFIREQEELISLSAVENFKIWDSYVDQIYVSGDERLSFHNAVDRMVQVYTRRLEVIDNDFASW